MTVAELREHLATWPDDMDVWTCGGGDPYCAGPVQGVRLVEPPRGMRPLGHSRAPERWLEVHI